MLPREEKDSPTCTKKISHVRAQNDIGIETSKRKNVTIKKFNNNTKIKLELWH